MKRPDAGAGVESTHGSRRRLNTTAIVLFLVFVVLIGDHIIGWIYFKVLCTDAGVHIYRTVHDVPGLRWQWADRDTALQYGYTFVKAPSSDGRVTQYVVMPHGITQHANATSISRYSAGFTPIETLALHVTTREYVIADHSAGEQLAIYTEFAYQGGWLIRALRAGFGGVGPSCPPEPFDYSTLVPSVLKPVTR